MKNIFKTLIVVAIITIAMVSVSAATITYDLVPFDEEANQWDLTVHINMEDESETCVVGTYESYFYFNSEKFILSDTDYVPVEDFAATTDEPIYPTNYGTLKKPLVYNIAIPTDNDGNNLGWVLQNDGKTVRGYVTAYTQSTAFDANDLLIYSISFKLAEGVTPDNLAYDDFEVGLQYIVDTANGKKYGYKCDGYANVDEALVIVNNVVPEAPVVVPVTIPVLAGDKVYLQDGTVATMAEANDAYEVPATVGYVAVNTGKTAQKTYYVDGTAATLVHTNGIVSTEENDLRGPDETSSVAEDTSGLRFLMNHNPANRTVNGHEITEIGVLMTVESNKVLAAIGSADNITFDMVDGGFVKSGYALGNGYDRAFNTEDDDNWVISAVMYNIKLNAANVQVNIVCRPFYKVGDTYIYGETMKATLYDVAKSIKEGGYVGCSDELKAYVDEIVALVDGEDTPVVEGEVLIDISSLYTNVG